MDTDDADPFGSCGLLPLGLQDKPLFDQFFGACSTRLSDYTFANTFIWRDSIHLHWQLFSGCLCVFANGDGGLTMLFPPIGQGDLRAALRRCLDICESYNARAGLEHWTRIEYISDELRAKFPGDFIHEPMSGDYVYLTRRLIDLAGGDLSSKRQARNRFARRYPARTELFESRHLPQCLELLEIWRQQAQQGPSRRLNADFKRAKEVAATADAMKYFQPLGLKGMVLYAGDELVGFTLGEMLSPDTCSILVEKTHRDYAGSAQYIFSEFCRQCWSGTTYCNVGDDWDLPSLAWTKQSYRPVMRVPKWVLRPALATLAGEAKSRKPPALLGEIANQTPPAVRGAS